MPEAPCILVVGPMGNGKLPRPTGYFTGPLKASTSLLCAPLLPLFPSLVTWPVLAVSVLSTAVPPPPLAPAALCCPTPDAGPVLVPWTRAWAGPPGVDHISSGSLESNVMSTMGKSWLELWPGPGGSVALARGLATCALVLARSLCFLLMWSLRMAADPRGIPLQMEQCQHASCAPPLCWLRMWAFVLRLYQIGLPHAVHSAAPLWPSPWSAGSSSSLGCVAILLLLLVVVAAASFPLLCPLLFLLGV